MLRHKRKPQLVAAIWEFAVTHVVSDDDKKDLLETFKALDVNSDGMISRKELLEGYRKVTTAELNDDQLNEIFNNIDNLDMIDGTFGIPYSSFLTAAISPEILLSDANLRTVFSMLDPDN